MFKNKLNNLLLASALVPLFVGCGSAPKAQKYSDTANSFDEVNRLRIDVQNAYEQQVNVLAPKSYASANKNLKSAIKKQEDGKEARKVLAEVAQGRAYLDQARKFADISKLHIEDVVLARRDALAAGAEKLFKEDLQKADKHLTNATADVEDNDLEEIEENRGKLQQEYLNIELSSIKKTYLGPAKELMEQAEKEGSEDYAKQSLAIADKRMKDTEAFILANRHDTDNIKIRSDEAFADANHLLKITRDSKLGKNINSEEVALRLENEQAKTQDQATQLSDEKKVSARLSNDNIDLEKKNTFNRKLKDARSKFSKDEAEVYQKGNQLVIRLRTLQFPRNQAFVRGSNFAILAKVAEVIQDFKGSTVVVEGHTDSDGGPTLNKKLSEERSRAVSQYLVSNQAIDKDKISSVGYGYEKPLATNKTSSGKSQNRRVDILINPVVVNQ